MALNITVKCVSGQSLSVTAESSDTVGDLKAKIQAENGTPPENMRLIYKGMVMKDGNTLQFYSLEDGHTIHMVVNAAPAGASVGHQSSTSASASPASPGIGGGVGNMASMQEQLMNDPNMMREMMNSPIMQQLMNNPEMMRGMIQNSPQMQAIIEQNPEIGHVLNDPAVLRQTMEVARSPELMREMMRTTDRAMSNIESHPEGFNMLRRMYHTVQEPLMDATIPGGRMTNAEASATTVDPNNPFADLFQPSTTRQPAAATPNPWAPSPAGNAQRSGGMGAGAGLGGLGGLGGMEGLGG
eukprot:CAMPEP_0181315944 /NCGR_PEP_ID=MMETSP1101-20121128/15637_1 /TAXON_ID=46948 /ORGANISM="Rhodomonas abbreviata, Strain Caron Lab Isolate" /LENGTH=297 /DNA_ID=CAMNT_0023423169 /DNA_START=26 /DNA_END=915 /DNA_ORIENTATION=-